LLRSCENLVHVLFVSFVLIYVFQALIITRIARFLDPSRFILFKGFVLVLFYWFYFIGFILFIVLWDMVHAVFLQLLACNEPPCDGVEAQ